MLDYIRIACAVPDVHVADTVKNYQDICNYMTRADQQNCDLVLFPELAITGYTCADLFFQESLLKGAIEGLSEICEYSKKTPALTAVVGLPLLMNGQIYNCAAVISNGVILGIIPKTYLPNYREFSESRWFASSEDLIQSQIDSCQLKQRTPYNIPVGRDLLFKIGDTCVGVEICEDLWSPIPPSTWLALNGAEVVLNLAASNETAGKQSFRRDLVKHQSTICSCVYAFASAGYTESTQDLVFSGHSLIMENGILLGENTDELQSDYMIVRDADLGRIRAERRMNNSVRDAITIFGKKEQCRIIQCSNEPLRADGTIYKLNKLPFIPEAKEQRIERCNSIFNIQVTGLMQRLKKIGANAVIGISGGLDSTLALLVAVEAMRRLGRPMTDIYGVTMPCYGTSDRTYRNAWELMKKLGVTAKEISIKNAVNLHFEDIGHDPSVFNGTYENAQARERTQILMDYASVVGGIVIGTGDLSELALGWCTYNGDHMSMYGVNASVPKTMIRWMIEAIAHSAQFTVAKDVLLDILDTPISPELLPPDESGKITQYTEDLVGPYALHDFFLYYMLRYGFAPGKIYTLACRAFQNDFGAGVIKKWMKAFYRRFFTQQFKRNCMPDGVKVGDIAVGPRGDWKMPSDAVGRIWLEEMDKL